MTRSQKPRGNRQRANARARSVPDCHSRVETLDDARPTDDDALIALGLRDNCAARRRRAAAE